MGYNIANTNLKPRFVLDLLEKQAELPSSSEIAKADEIELEEIAEKASDIISQIKDVQTLMSSMAWVKRCYSEKSKNLNRLLVFEALYP